LKILFIDKVFLRGKHQEAVVGVEKFNLHLLNDLAGTKHELSIYCDQSWKKELKKKSNFKHITLFTVPQFFKVPWPNMVLALVHALFKSLAGQKYDVVLLGNVGKVIIPFFYLLLRLGISKRVVLIAHREPNTAFLKALKPFDCTVVSVNKIIAKQFLDAGIKNSHTYYGVNEPKDYLGISRPAKKEDETLPIKFCVYGNLEPDWKGADTAVEAFKLLPENLKGKVELHLAGYSKNAPTYDIEGVKIYEWLTKDEVIQFLSKMDVAIFPSRDTAVMKETFSQSSVQAMLSGLPIIVSSLPILKEKVESGGGLVFTSGAKELAVKMSGLAESESLRHRLGEEARSIAKENYVWSTEVFQNTYLAKAS